MNDNLHPLVGDTIAALRGPRPGRVIHGLLLPLKAAKFLLGRPELLPLVILPALINLVLFGLTALLLIWNLGGLVDWLWSKPDIGAWYDWLWLGLWYVAYVLGLLLAIVVSYAVVLVVGGVVASPFNDALSARTERLLTGAPPPDGHDESLAAGVLRSAASSGFIGLAYLVVMVPILLLNLVPVAGSVAATIIGGAVSAFFLSLEYGDPTFERHAYRLRDKTDTIREHFALCGGFGLGTSLMLWVPLLNFVCMPVAVVGGTAMVLAVRHAEP